MSIGNSLTLLILLFSNISFSQKTFRRHFIIAYDVSTPFIVSENNCPAYTQALINLFSNKAVYNYNEAYQDNLNVEKKNGLLFFDKDRDEISFFHFNVAGSEFDRLRWTAANGYDEKGIVGEFSKLFLKDKKLDWTNFASKGNQTTTDYLRTALSLPPTPSNFNGGVSMSNFVYPLVLDKIDTTKYAEEYVLIILSDFLTGSMLGNTKDLDRVKDIYRVPYGIELPPNSPVSFVKKKIDYLASQYYKIDFFQYAFNSTPSNPIGIIAFKIKPKIGVLTPEDVSLFVDGDLSLDQRGYLSENFKTSETKIKFTHNKNIVPIEMKMTVLLPSKLGSKIFFDDVVASKNGDGLWESKFTEDKELMLFDSLKLTYFVPKLKISLDSAINIKNFEGLIIKYEFKTKYTVANAQPLNFIYSTERALPIENIDYSTKATIIIMYYLLPILAILLLLICLAFYGKPIKLSFHIEGYLDSFEKIDFKTDGKLLTPYKAWPPKDRNNDYLLVKGKIEYRSPDFLLNWNPLIYLQLENIAVPTGFDMFLKQNPQSNKEFAPGYKMTIKKGKDNELLFYVGIRQNTITEHVINPELVKFKVETCTNDSILFIKSDLKETIPYNFHIGADLGDVWVGFDPGTSGSCIAVGNATDNIILVEDGANKKIIPSVLVFEKAANFQSNGTEIPDSIYKYGTAADAVYETVSRFIGFKSIKKQLGFKDDNRIIFENKNALILKGKDLASLLVKGLFKDLITFFNKANFSTEEYKRNGKFDPLRAVVAIPNSYTSGKIQDMLDCIGNLNQFKEIRYVYEAEAVLFYYLSNSQKINNGEDITVSETILIFDMGGATINATIVTANKISVNGRAKYDIDFLGKIGYRVGGDSIDFCIIKFILSCTNEFPELKDINMLDKKVQLDKLSFEIKKEIIANYLNQDYLITEYRLETYINKALNTSIRINKETSEMYSYFQKSAGKFKLFAHPIFEKTIYRNVRDAVKEVVELSDALCIDKVIFSGRSTAFPMIKETVEVELNSKKDKIKSFALELEDSKTAVAKGACWYGINKNSIIMHNLKTCASFGFKKTLTASSTNVKYYELVKMGCPFNNDSDGVRETQKIRDDFAFDNAKVNFYQVMGKDGDNILSREDQKHKCSKIATISIDQMTSEVGMKVTQSDEVDCIVMLETNQKLYANGRISDQDIDDANDEHYTWIVKQ